jgi:DNA-binding response OmpR family regulator
MMPELDGNATMRAIRRMPQFADLPIIALTAKAMKGDREKSIRAGASDYFPKPVETDHLLQLMRHWLRRSAPQATSALGSAASATAVLPATVLPTMAPGTDGRTATSH